MTTTTTTTSVVGRGAAAGHGEGDWRERLARFGLAGKGIVHLVVGFAVWRLATGGGNGEEASSTGALGWIADLPFGTVLLWVLAASLASLALWRGIETFAGDPAAEDDALHRIGFAGKALVYGALAALAVRTALDGSSGSGSAGGSGSSASGSGSATSTVFDLPFGRWIVFAVGLGVMAVAVHLIAVHTLDGRFVQRLECTDDSLAARFGRVGYGLRSLAYIAVGFFLADAGLNHDPDQATGLSGSLRRLTDETWGIWLLYVVAVGFAAYGVYCFFEAKLRRAA